MTTHNTAPRTLTTGRLTLRPFKETDFETFHQLHGDAGLTASMHRGALDAAESHELFDAYRNAFEADGFGMRAVCWQQTGEMIGECGLWMRETAGGYTLRYMLFEGWWGQGLTGEAARATVRQAFGMLALRELFAVAMDGNVHSVKALRSLGMEKVERDHRGIAGFGRYRLAHTDFLGR